MNRAVDINRFHTPAEYKLIDTYGVGYISSRYQDVPGVVPVTRCWTWVLGHAIENRLDTGSESSF